MRGDIGRKEVVDRDFHATGLGLMVHSWIIGGESWLVGMCFV